MKTMWDKPNNQPRKQIVRKTKRKNKRNKILNLKP